MVLMIRKETLYGTQPYNIDLAPNCTQFQYMIQRNNDSFKEYAQRWRELAAWVQPLLLDEELINMFMGTLQFKYMEKMVGYSFWSFFDVVAARERIESHVKKGKLPSTANASVEAKKSYSNFPKKKEGETNIMIWARNNGAQYLFAIPYHQVEAIAPVPYPEQIP